MFRQKNTKAAVEPPREDEVVKAARAKMLAMARRFDPRHHSCGNCIYHGPYPVSESPDETFMRHECRRYPPRVMRYDVEEAPPGPDGEKQVKVQRLDVWPATPANFWCGEWRRRPGQGEE